MKIIRILSKVFILLLLATGLFLGTLTALEYRPDDLEEVDVKGNTNAMIQLNETIRLMAFNIGYAGLGADEDFVMDGGTKGRPDSKDDVLYYLSGIKDLLTSEPIDIYLLQEVDRPSRRSYGLDQEKVLHEYLGLDTFNYSFGINFKAHFVPFPVSFTDYIGAVESGVQSLSRYDVDEAYRHQFPGAFSWPGRVANLKRCMLVSYLPIDNSEQKLILINVHMSAYDDGSMREQEMAYLKSFIEAAYAEGHYVIVGGDFNQTFPGAEDIFPVKDDTFFAPSIIAEDFFSDDFTFYYDPTVPTSRLLNQPYDPQDKQTQYYIIDGYLLSNNIVVTDIYTIDDDFRYSDHNPVVIEISLIDSD